MLLPVLSSRLQKGLREGDNQVTKGVLLNTGESLRWPWKMPLLREPAALACSALRARSRHRVPGASPEVCQLWFRRLQSPRHNDHVLAQHARKLWSYQLSNPTWAQRRLRADALVKVCTRLLLHSVSLPLFPDPFIPTPQLVDDVAMGSNRVDWPSLATHCRLVCDVPLCADCSHRLGNSVRESSLIAQCTSRG